MLQRTCINYIIIIIIIIIILILSNNIALTFRRLMSTIVDVPHR